MGGINMINLIRSKAVKSDQVDRLTQEIKRISRIAIIAFFSMGAIVVGIYVFFNQQKQSLTDRRDTLITQIGQDKTKEGVYVSLKDRITLIQNALSFQKAWGTALDSVVAVAKPPQLTAIRVDDKNVISFSVEAGSIDEVIGVVNSFVQTTSERHIRNPQLTNFQLAPDGSVNVGISFVSAL